jgi:hypothetical protein
LTDQIGIARQPSKGMSSRIPIPVLPDVAQDILAGARRSADGCLITSAKGRPVVRILDNRQVYAARVIAAVTLGRPILPTEDVHHSCENPRCLDAEHLVVCSTVDHRAHHAAQRRQEVCSVHGTRYDRHDARGWGICNACRREATARFRRHNPPKPLTDEQRARKRVWERAWLARKRAARSAA